MKGHGIRSIFCLLAIFASIFFLNGPALAVPGLVSYQGRITDSSGIPLEGTLSTRFVLYDSLGGGAQIWTEDQDVPVTGGVYNVQLGSVSPLAEAVFADDAVYLEVLAWNTDTSSWETLSPRQRLTSTAFAFRAATANSAEDAGTLDGQDSTAFAPVTHNHDGTYVNEGQAGSITSSMIVDSTVTGSDLQDGAALAEIADDDGAGSGLDADRLDGLDSSAFMSSASDYGRSGVAASLYEGASTLTSLYVNEGQANSITSSMIVDSTVTAADLAADSVGASEIAADAVGYSEIASNAVREDEIRWSINHTAADLNGGILSLTNSSNSDSGNYPMGVAGQATGTPAGNPVIGVFGGAPGLGQGAPTGSFPDTKIGVGGASDTGHGVAGVSTSGYGVYAYSGSSYGVYAYSPDSYAVYGYGYSRGLYGYATSQYSAGAYGYSTGSNGYGVYGYASGSAGYGGYFLGSGSTGTGIYASGGSSGKAAVFRGNVEIQRESDGTTIMELGAGLDYAEGFDVTDNDGIEPGSVLVINPENPGKLALSREPYDTKVAGIVAGANGLGSGVRLGAGQFDRDVALAGRVHCNVDASREGVEPGDLLTTSDIPGHAMKATDHKRARGAVIGKAMDRLEKGTTGLILVLVTLQ